MNDGFEPDTHKLTANVKAGGCAAKISSAELHEILASVSGNDIRKACPELMTGIDNFEDAAVYKLSERSAIIQTVDFFPPVVDDPYLFGVIAATNALSDIYAMGGRPILALNVLCFPTCDFPLEVVARILKGGADQVARAGAVIAGGHSIQSPEPVYGLAVTGLVDPAKVLTNSGAKAGDKIVLCKPIGTGVALLGMKGQVLSKDAEDALINGLTTLNNHSLDAALHTEQSELDIQAATDITGFGLIGHIHEMSKGSGLAARLKAREVPLLPQVLDLAEQGFVPAGAYANRKSFEQFVCYIKEVDLALTDLFFDPQTAGGLLFAVEAKAAESLVSRLSSKGINAAIIGEFFEGTIGQVELVE